jgi:phosphomannomutase
MDYRQLKSGSDIRGTATETGREAVDLTAEAVKDITGGFAQFLTGKINRDISAEPLRIALGRDSRLSGEALAAAATDALKKAGASIYDCGLCSTPSMSEMTKFKETACDGAIMITASHHPFNKNGLKFFTASGGLSPDDIDALLSFAENKNFPVGKRTVLYKKDFLKLYIDKLLDLVRSETNDETPLKGLKIVLDAGNGAGGFYAGRFLAALGADTEGSQFLNPDGNFPNHAPNPEDPAAMNSISECVKKTGADLGIIFDTDVDRAAVVDAGGKEINRNKLIALLSAIVLEERKGAVIVTDSVTSDGLKDFIQKSGGVHFRYKRGYNNVINQAKKLCGEGLNAELAIETSGHAAFRENDFLDDGAYLVTKILIKTAKLKKEGKTLSGLIDGLREPRSAIETRIYFRDGAGFKTYADTVITDLKDFCKEHFVLDEPNFEGVRAKIDDLNGWFLMRRSVHDPNMVLNIESDNPSGAVAIAKILYKFLSNYSGLKTEKLKEVI